MNIEQRVKELATELFCCDVTNETTLESLKTDDLDVVVFVVVLEDEFDVTLDEEAVEHLDTIQGFIDLVVNLKVA